MRFVPSTELELFGHCAALPAGSPAEPVFGRGGTAGRRARWTARKHGWAELWSGRAAQAGVPRIPGWAAPRRLVGRGELGCRSPSAGACDATGERRGEREPRSTGQERCVAWAGVDVRPAVGGAVTLAYLAGRRGLSRAALVHATSRAVRRPRGARRRPVAPGGASCVAASSLGLVGVGARLGFRGTSRLGGRRCR
jgi:hypothetical protein